MLKEAKKNIKYWTVITKTLFAYEPKLFLFYLEIKPDKTSQSATVWFIEGQNNRQVLMARV